MGMIRNIALGEIYHLYNRGVNSQIICLDDNDRQRLLFVLLHCQSPLPFNRNLDRYLPSRAGTDGTNNFSVTRKVREKIIAERLVGLINFCIMGNHFHVCVQEKMEGGISKYMQRVLNSYTKYFNTRHKRKGHLFEGPYKLVHVTSNTQLLHLSAYIHRNPRDLREWRNREYDYPWSSCRDYVGGNRFDELLDRSIVLGQFPSNASYKKFLSTSTAKTRVTQLGNEHFFED